jgi:L-rhamnose-H+ transport protein
MTPNPLFGALLHAFGATSAALCYTPQKRTRSWSWQTYWLAQAAVCWLILPWVVAWLTVPQLMTVLREAPADVLVKTVLLGALYGIGGTAFGVAIRFIGFSVTYAIAIGISCVLGTLLTPFLSGELAALFGKTGASWVLAGVVVATLGILASGLAGWLKDADSRKSNTMPEGFHLGKGLFFCVLAGLLSAVFGLSLDAGKPIAAIAAQHGAGQFEGNVVYIFSCGGAFLTTAVYSLYLHFRHRTMGEYVELPAGEEKAALSLNFSMAALTGCLWYGQFFFYGLGHVRMGDYKFTSWAIHMSMLVLFSTLAGVAFREWKGCRPRTLTALVAAIFVLLVAVGLLTYGNYLGSKAAAQTQGAD